MDEIRKVFKDNLDYWLRKKGITKKELAAKSGIPYVTIQKWGKGDTYPRSDKIQILAENLGISPDDLVRARQSGEEKPEDLRDFYLLNEKDQHIIRQLIRLMLNEYKAG